MKYISDSQGPSFAEAVLLDLKATLEESTPQVPLVCFLSMGSDPTAQIEELAKKMHIGACTVKINKQALRYWGIGLFPRILSSPVMRQKLF